MINVASLCLRRGPCLKNDAITPFWIGEGSPSCDGKKSDACEAFGSYIALSVSVSHFLTQPKLKHFVSNTGYSLHHSHAYGLTFKGTVALHHGVDTERLQLELVPESSTRQAIGQEWSLTTQCHAWLCTLSVCGKTLCLFRAGFEKQELCLAMLTIYSWGWLAGSPQLHQNLMRSWSRLLLTQWQN